MYWHYVSAIKENGPISRNFPCATPTKARNDSEIFIGLATWGKNNIQSFLFVILLFAMIVFKIQHLVSLGKIHSKC